VRASFGALARLVAHGADYVREFGTTAQVRASPFLRTSGGRRNGISQERVALLGDTLNIAARLVDACRALRAGPGDA
jgi:adenylate cyclase